jgi:hypothetical protein
MKEFPMKITKTSSTSLASTCAVLAVAIGGGITLQAQEHEKSNTGALAKAPPAVQKTVKQLVGSNKIDEFGTETTLGKTLSVVEFSVKGKEYAFGIDPAGNVVVRWVGVDASVVPPVVDAAKKAHPDGKVSEVTIATVGDRMFYSVNVKTGKGLHEMEIGPGGSVSADRIKGKED